MRPIHEYRVFLFDCDGVLLDSNPAKTAAFREILAGYPAAMVDRFVAEHRAAGGVSRYAKLRRFFTELVPVQDPERAVADAAARYSVASRAALADVPLVPGVTRLLARLRAPAYVVSGADQGEVRDVLAQRGLDSAFADILGSPTPKEDNVAALAAAGRLTTPGLFFGDARKDMDVAEAHGLDFVFVSGFSDWADGSRVCAERGHHVVRDLAQV